MNNIFCPNCGKGNQYAATRPNFCMYCAAPLSPMASNASSTPQESGYQRPPSRSQTVRGGSRRNEPAQVEFRQTEDEAIAEVQEIADRTKISLSVVDAKRKMGEKADLSQIFAGGAVGFRNTGAQADLHDNKTTFGGGDKDRFLKDYFGKNMQKTVIDSAGGE